MLNVIKAGLILVMMTGCVTTKYIKSPASVCVITYQDTSYVSASCDGHVMGCTALTDGVGMACWNEHLSCKTDPNGYFYCKAHYPERE